MRPSLHPLAVVGLIGAALALILLVVGLGMLIVILKDSRDHIRAQDAKTAILLGQLRAATPTARQVPAVLDEVRPLVRNLGDAIGPLRRATAATATATAQLPTLVRFTEALARTGVPVLSDLGQVNLARALLAGGTVADALLYRDRLTSALDATNRLLAQVRAQNLVAVSARAARETPGLMRQLLALQAETLKTQRVSLQTQLATLDIQRQALVSIKSIDRKTGGTVPAQGPPVPAP